MNPAVVLRRTAKGSEELQTRAHGLEPRLRTALILVNGTASVGEICATNAVVPDLAARLQALVERGMAEPVAGTAAAPAPRPGIEEMRQEMIRIAAALLDRDAGRVVSVIESAAATPEALNEALARARKMVRLLIDEAKAEELARRCAGVLARGGARAP